jgi:hypothetical protein
MKAKDLMIGDWVHNPFTRKKLRLTFGRDIDLAEELCLEPIPLTAEILEKNGFEELMNESEVSAARFGRKPEPTGVWQYGFGQFDSVAYVPEQSFLCIKFMEGYMADIANIKYVHELQHALKLLDIDIDIEL